MFSKIITGFAFLVLCANSSFAERYETTKLFSHKAWSVELTNDQLDGDFWCTAKTRNRSGQQFSVTTYDNGHLGLFVFDTRWKLSPRDIRFRIDVDYSRWTVDGNADDTAVSTLITEAESGIKFLTEVAEGRAVAIYNLDGNRIALFSLSGSSASLRKLFECWAAIKNGAGGGTSTDPFKSTSDPF